MTWKEFKQILEDSGVKDEHEIWYIDVSYPEALDLNVDVDENTNEFTVFS